MSDGADHVKKTILVLPVLLALSALLQVAHAFAHGNVLEIVRERAGPYEVVVAILPERPAVGKVHFSITPMDASSGVLVTDADVVLVANNATGEPIYQSRAVNLPHTPHFYDANIKFESPGTWTMVISLENESVGDARLSFSLEIEEQAIIPARAGAVVFLGVFAVLVGGAVYVWQSARRASRRRGQPSP